MYFLYTKAFHLIFIVTWFAGLFYIVRLFIYHTEAQEKEDAEKTILSNQFVIMEKTTVVWNYMAFCNTCPDFSFGDALS